jgi:hypothetical protein
MWSGFRVLTLFPSGSTVYGFSVMLATILAGSLDRQLQRDRRFCGRRFPVG